MTTPSPQRPPEPAASEAPDGPGRPPAAPRRRLLKGTVWPLIAWRAGGVGTWLAHRVTPERIWSLVPGELVVATVSDQARVAIEASLAAQSERRVFKVVGYRSLLPGGEQDRTSPIVGAWLVNVARGSEQPVLRELEYRVALALETAGGYQGIDTRLSLAAARHAMAAHQSRRVRLAAQAMVPSAAIAFTPMHERYRELIATGAEPSRPVSVAILDSAVNLGHLPPEVADRVHPGEASPDYQNLTPGAHGAVTASVIASLAGTADIEVFPIAGVGSPGSEAVVAASLMKAKASVIAMCLSLDIPPNHREGKTREEMIGLTLRKLDTHQVVIVASGNRLKERHSAAAIFPATSPTVMMVGALDSELRRPFFSRHLLTDRRPASYLMAPGGRTIGSRVDESSVHAGQTPFVGTSVAAAYAAGIVARTLGTLREGEEAPTFNTLFAALEVAARRDFEGYAEVEHGSGLIQQLIEVPAAMPGLPPKEPPMVNPANRVDPTNRVSPADEATQHPVSEPIERVILQRTPYPNPVRPDRPRPARRFKRRRRPEQGQSPVRRPGETP
ncbi:S8/S53 family peptidase [Jatrophihabitans sp. DSM 45814]